MIGRVVEFSARHRWLVLFVFVIVAFGADAARRRVQLDAIPDLSDPQVIVFTDWPGRSPTLVEDQITYPVSSALLASPHVTGVRGYSMFGMSFVYVLFEEGTDVYWARSRVLESLSTLGARLPPGASPVLGPDATGIGWVYEYALVDRTGKSDTADLRKLQDFTIKYALESVPGVAQVASVGGFSQRYEVAIDPDKMRSFGVTLDDVASALRRSSSEVSGRLLEMGGREYYVRGRGYAGSASDLRNVVVKATPAGASVRVKDIGTARLGPDARRGAIDFGGEGEAVGGIIVMRYGENARDVIRRVEARLVEVRRSLPAGVKLVTTYDRSGLIDRSIATLKSALTEEMVVVALVVFVFLLHVRSALLPIVSLPLAVLMAFLPMYFLGIPSTIMSLGGIAIAIGAIVDAEIVMVEACHKKLEHAPKGLSLLERKKLLAEAAREVTPAIFLSLLIIAASFLPVFGLNGQAGRLFRPLAFTKTFVMLAAAVLSITLAPALRDLLIRGDVRPESRHPISRAVIALYEPFVFVALRRPMTTVLIGVLAVVSAVPLLFGLGSEFMPPLDEGDLVYMPTTLPNLSMEEAKRQLELQDTIIRGFPEVETVFGKVGRAETATDPAPLSMVETTIHLAPQGGFPRVHHQRWYSARAPGFMKPLLRALWPEEARETTDELVQKLNTALRLPGWTNAWTMPIRTRVDMLTTGVRTAVGIRVLGDDLAAIERVGKSVEAVLARVPGTRSALYERTLGGSYLDVVPDREKLARFGLTVGDVHDVVEGAIGGEPLATSVDGRARYPIALRLLEDFRATPGAIRNIPVPLSSRRAPAKDATVDGMAASPPTVPLGDVARVEVVPGPPMLRSEAGRLVGYVYVDVDPSRDLGSYVADAQKALDRARAEGQVVVDRGMILEFTGEYQHLAEMRERMKILIPLALAVIVLLLYLQFRSVAEVAIVLLSIPFALVGSVWALHLLDYRLSTAVWVGVIALIGLAAQTGVVMIVYIDQAFFRRLRAGKVRCLDDIIWAHMEGTVLRVRPKLMTVSTMLMGLLPLLFATGSGADVMKRIAAPMVGGLVTSAFLTLEIIPVVYTYFRYAQLKRAQRTGRPLSEIVGVR